MALKPLIAWVKANKLASSIIVVLIITVFAVLGIASLGSSTGVFESVPGIGGRGVGTPEFDGGVVSDEGGIGSSGKDRVVIEESALSMVASDVPQTAEDIVTYAEKEGGFLVSSEITSPEESPVATVSVRVPSAKLRSVIEYFKTLAVKVVSENIIGIDVTKEYKDLDSRIATLEETINQFQTIKAQATKIADLVSITEQIIALREKIDALKGQKQFIADSAAYPKITVSLATDEFALPYQPPEGFRPGVVFKQAVRALLSSIYSVAGGLIWVGVYATVVIPLLVLAWYLLKRFKVF